MELQRPLILFTTFISASAGLLAAQGCYALAGEGRKTQLLALIASVVIMAIGGIAVFFHLTHPDRLFNGFGYITSGITQELIAVVATFVVMVIFFVYLRRSDENPPKWLAWIAVLVSLVLVAVMGHSCMMPARPTWDGVLQPLSLIDSGFAMGIGIFAALDAMRSQSAATCSGTLTLASSGLGSLTTICYAIAMSACESTFVSVGYRYDPTHPMHALVDAANYSGFLRRVAVVDSSRNRTRPRSIRLHILGQEVCKMEHCRLAHRNMLVRKRHPASHGLLHHRRQRLRLLASIQARKANLQRCVPPIATSQKGGTHPKP